MATTPPKLPQALELHEVSLTPKQKKLLEFIHESSARNGYAPSQQEIAAHFGFQSLGTVQNYLVRLERQGALKKTWNARRSLKSVIQLKPIPSTTTPLSLVLPLLGRVAAGRPIEVVPESSPDARTFEVPAAWVSMRGQDSSRYFVLQVVGQSMVEEGIFDQDFVIIKKQSTAEAGETVVALVDNEATIKKFRPRKGWIELEAANPAYPSIRVTPDQDFKIEGVLVSVVRKMV